MRVVRTGILGTSAECSSCGKVSSLQKDFCHETEGGFRIIPSFRCSCGHVADFAAEGSRSPSEDLRLHWLEKINPWWLRFGLAVVLVVIVAVGYLVRTPSPSAVGQIESDRQRELVSALKVKTEWKRAGFDNVAIVTFALENWGGSAAKDFEFTCDVFGSSGTRISTLKKTIFGTIDARGRATFRDVNVGLVDPQATRLECSVTGAKVYP